MPSTHRIGLAPAGSGHPRVRQFRNIKHNRGGNPAGSVALEGLWAIRHALDASLPVEVVFVCSTLLRGDDGRRLVDELCAAGTTALEVSERVLRSCRLDDLAVGETSRIVVADGFELAGNLGTLVRCADGAGAAGLVVTDRRIRLTHPLVLKASVATVFSMPLVEAGRPEALGWLRRHRFRVIAGDPGAPVSYRDADYRGRVAIVLGSERYGLARFWVEAADLRVSIPMLGVADSLNVTHAAALLLYEALHQQRGTSGDGG